MLEEVYRVHGFAVFRRCRRLLGNEAEAKDMVQEVFLKALENPEAFQGRSSASTYLYGVATNLCLNKMRNQSVRSEAWQQAVAAELERNPPVDPLDQVALQQLVALLLGDADELTCAIAIYHWVDGLSQSEIGDLVGLSRVTINQRLGRLRATARALTEKS